MEKLVVSPVEAAKMLQTRPDTIRELCDNNELLYYKVGRNYKIPVEALKKYVMKTAENYGSYGGARK